MKTMVLCLVVFSLVNTPVLAEEGVFLTVTKQSAYGPALDELTAVIENHDYTLIKIQPVDEGLRNRGYTTSAYKVLFFGNQEQVDKVLAVNPEASVLFPLRIILYKKGSQVVASAPDINLWEGVFGNNLQPILEQWDNDVRAILMEFSNTPPD